MNSVDHLEIQGEEEARNCTNYFRKATKLTLSHRFVESRVSLSIYLERIIPLNQLSTLIIDCNDFCFEQLIRVLRFTPNIHTLAVSCPSISGQYSISIQQTETFPLAININTIRNLTIREKSSSENLKLLLALCPQIQQLTIDTYTDHIRSIVRFILMKTKTNLQQLCSMRIKDIAKPMSGTLTTLIESEKLLDNYSVKLIDTELYFWW